MKPEAIDQLRRDVEFVAMRSSGPGGQHVNKTSTKIVAILDLGGSAALTETEKLLVRQKLSHRLTQEGKLMVASQDSRSQLQNRENSFQRLVELLDAALVVPKRRKKTKVPNAARRKRLSDKRQKSEKKGWRKSPE